jgi:hypothetical protein
MKKIILSFVLVLFALCLSSCFKAEEWEIVDILQLNAEEPDKVYKVGDTVKFNITGTFDTNLYDQYEVSLMRLYKNIGEKEYSNISCNDINYNLSGGKDVITDEYGLVYKLSENNLYNFNDQFNFLIENTGNYSIFLGISASDKNDWRKHYDGCKEIHFTVTE